MPRNAVPKRVVNHYSSVCIFYRRENPCQVLMEVKDHGHPNRAFRGVLGCLGGNKDRASARDLSPLGTLLRELNEEWSLKSPVKGMEVVNLSTLAAAKPGTLLLDSSARQTVPGIDVAALGRFADSARNSLSSWLAFLGSPDVERVERTTAIISYWECGLDEETWDIITRLTEKYGHFSNESVTVMTSFAEIMEVGIQLTPGHDQALRWWGIKKGVPGAADLQCVSNYDLVPVHAPHDSYIISDRIYATVGEESY